MTPSPKLDALYERAMKKYYAMDRDGKSQRQIAAAIGISESTLRGYIKRLERPTFPKEFQPDVVVEPFPDDELPIEDVIEFRKREFAAKKKHEEATKLIQITVNIPGPIGILHFGDPHVDDDGTDIATLESHSDLTRETGIFGANCGDTTNAWVGRLARLYGDQNTSRKRAIKIAEWFITRTNWMYMVGGNHDGWAGEDDPIKWIAKQVSALYRPSEARLQLNFPEGDPFTINARHDFSGGSMWNPTHGPMKAAQMGIRDDLFTCGHKHKSGYGVLKDPSTERTIHTVQVGSYKLYDRYAKDKGFRDQSLGPACMTVIDPLLDAGHPDRCKLFWDPHRGAQYVRFLRNHYFDIPHFPRKP